MVPKKNLSEINLMGKKLLEGGKQLTSDHPGFTDEEYKKRREEFAKISASYNMGDDKIPSASYNKIENSIWNLIFNKLKPLHSKYASKQYLENFEELEQLKIFSDKEIPQMNEVSNFLKKKCNWLFRPVGGLLSQREFLNGLAFRIFHCTQYIRHQKAPLYTPEPDVIHEYLGHAPMFSNKDFCDFSQEIGLASLGASEEDCEKLGNIYWFTIEFGVCMENSQRKIYGAGILSSPSETEWAGSDKPEFKPFDLHQMGIQPYNISEIQKVYFMAPSFPEMKEAILKYSDKIKKPFNLTYNYDSETIDIDRKIEIREEIKKNNEKIF